jgi:uncharacterized protein
MTRAVTTNGPASFSVQAKPTGAVCNLDCAYCYFLSKDSLYPNSRFRMADDVLERYISQVIDSQRVAHVSIAWQGGEPTLMGLPFFKRAMGLVRKHLRKGMTVEHMMQTNGTLLDEAWCAFFRQHDVRVGLSIDGTREMHDAYRVDKGGQGTFDRVVGAARLMKAQGVPFNIACAVHTANGDRPLEVYRFFRDELGARHMQFIPIVERATPELIQIANRGWSDHQRDRPMYVQQGNLVTDRSVRPEQWGRFLITIFDEWVRRDVGDVFVQIFDAAVATWVGLSSSMCIFNETCGTAPVLEHNGDVYSCDHYTEPGYLLGNVKDTHMRDLVASPQQRAFGLAKRDTLPRYCRECHVRFACNGECPRNRFMMTPDGESGLNYLCAGYKAFFEHIDYPMRLMADLLRQGRLADEVMPMLAAQH